MLINFNSINIIWGWDWMSPPLFAIDLPWIPWVGLPWGCPIITISCTPPTPVVRPIYIKVCPHPAFEIFITTIELRYTTYPLPPPMELARDCVSPGRMRYKYGGLPSSELTSPSDPAWPAPQYEDQFSLTSTSLPTRWNPSCFSRSSQLSYLLLRRDIEQSGKGFSWMI